MTVPRPSAPPAVLWIARTLEDAGFETWTVGGAVRDVLLGLPAGDWDLATRARPEDVRRLFRRTVPLGVEHGTVGVVAAAGEMFEVTTFRRDVETDGRHAVVAFADTVEDDLARRDFTINAIAWHPLREEFLDPFGGAGDLEARVLRCVGEPDRRFREDYLRVLRACRFAGRLRLEIDGATWQAMKASVEELQALSPERIREELVKVLEADPTPSRALELYHDAGILAVLYPELAAAAQERPGEWAHTMRAVDVLPPRSPFLRLAMLLCGLEARAAAQILVRLRLSNVQVEEAARRAGAPDLPDAAATDADVRRWLSRVGPERVAAVARLELARARSRTEVGEGAQGATPADVVASWRRVKAVRASRPPLSVADLAIDGRDLIRLGLRPGPAFGRILERLLDRVLEDPTLNTPEALEKWVDPVAADGRGEREGDGD